MKTLVIDESQAMRNIVKNSLKHLGFTDLEEAGNGEEGLDKVRTYQPDLIITGWHMPKMNGITFAKSVRANNINTPIIMVSAEVEKIRVIEAVRAGVSQYIAKPFTPDVLMKHIRETIHRFAIISSEKVVSM